MVDSKEEDHREERGISEGGFGASNKGREGVHERGAKAGAAEIINK